MKEAASDVSDQNYNSVYPIDDLDAACRLHDYRCGRINSDKLCHKVDDQKLVDAAMNIVKGRYPKKLKAKALGLAAAIKGAKFTRGSGMEGGRGKWSEVGDDYEFGDIIRWILDRERPEKLYRRHRSIAQAIDDHMSGSGMDMEGGRGLFTDVAYNYKFGDIIRWILDMERPEKKVYYPGW